MTLSTDKITDIFYLIDEFCLEFEKTIRGQAISSEMSPRESLK